MEPESSDHVHKSASGPDPRPDESIPHRHNLFH
jgi:hypothetical protein